MRNRVPYIRIKGFKAVERRSLIYDESYARIRGHYLFGTLCVIDDGNFPSGK